MVSIIFLYLLFFYVQVKNYWTLVFLFPYIIYLSIYRSLARTLMKKTENKGSKFLTYLLGISSYSDSLQVTKSHLLPIRLPVGSYLPFLFFIFPMKRCLLPKQSSYPRFWLFWVEFINFLHFLSSWLLAIPATHTRTHARAHAHALCSDSLFSFSHSFSYLFFFFYKNTNCFSEVNPLPVILKDTRRMNI